jgi:hypothetical protein
MLGLRGWIAALVSNRPRNCVRLSRLADGPSSPGCGEQISGRPHLLELNDCKGFKPSGKYDRRRPRGVRRTSTEGYLTFAATARTAWDGAAQIRNPVEPPTTLARCCSGPVYPAASVSGARYRLNYSVKILAVRPHATDLAISAEEPEPSFYDLHGAVRELLQQDVPFLASRALAKKLGPRKSPNWTSPT